MGIGLVRILYMRRRTRKPIIEHSLLVCMYFFFIEHTNLHTAVQLIKRK